MSLGEIFEKFYATEKANVDRGLIKIGIIYIQTDCNGWQEEIYLLAFFFYIFFGQFL